MKSSFDFLIAAIFLLTKTGPLSCQLTAQNIVGYKWREDPAEMDSSGVTSQDKRSLTSLQVEMKVAANGGYTGFFELNPGEPPSGVDAEIVKALSKSLNFTYRIVQPADGLWGNPLPNGTVTGLIGLVARGEVDFAICAIIVTGLRESVVDFTFPYQYEPLTMFSRAPQERNRALAVLSPFTLLVWACIFGATLIIAVILKLEAMLASYLMKNRLDWSLQIYFFNMFRNLTIQGNLLKSPDWPQRLIFFSWYAFCLIIASIYSGMLLTVLAIPAYEKTVDSLSDLPRAVEVGFTIGTLQGSNMAALFREAKDGLYKQTWELFSQENPSDSFVDYPMAGIQRVLKDPYIYIDSKIATEMLMAQMGKHKFHVAPETFSPQGFAIACRPGAPFIDTFSERLMRMREGGLVSKWIEDEMNKLSGRSIGGSFGLKSSAITVIHLQAAFFIFILGLSSASTAFLIENCVSYKSSA